MDLYNLKNKKLSQINQKPFNLEKDIQSVVEQNTQELFNIDFVTSEFSLGNFRIDSLCYDEENKSFVIIEYKKGKSYSVIDQGYSYLSLMLNNKSDFILEYNENKKNSIKRGDVDWSSSKVIFISPSFNTYQKNSVNFQDVPFELWEIKKYSNNMIGLNQHISSSKESIQKFDGNKNSVIKDVSTEIKVFSEGDHLKNTGKKINELYFTFKEIVLESLEVNFRPKKKHIGIWDNHKNMFSYVVIRKSFILVNILSGFIKNRKSPLFKLNDPDKKFILKDYDHKKLYSYKLTNSRHIDYILLMIKQKYDWDQDRRNRRT